MRKGRGWELELTPAVGLLVGGFVCHWGVGFGCRQSFLWGTTREAFGFVGWVGGRGVHHISCEFISKTFLLQIQVRSVRCRLTVTPLWKCETFKTCRSDSTRTCFPADFEGLVVQIEDCSDTSVNLRSVHNLHKWLFEVVLSSRLSPGQDLQNMKCWQYSVEEEVAPGSV